jgi:hypothetical protein
MGVVKGDRLGRSGKLAQLPLQSALAYAWIVSVPRARDDFGAFQWDPGSVRAACFPLRPEVTTDQVAAWLEEWLRAGLVVRYTDSDGVLLGCFTNFQGEPRPRYHRFELPVDIAHECRPACQRSGMRVLAKRQVIKKMQRRPKASQKPATRGVPSLPSSSPPLLLDRTDSSGAAAPGGGAPPTKPAKATVPGRETWLTGYGADWQARWGVASKPPWGEMAAALRAPHEEHGEERLRVAWRTFLGSKEQADYARPVRFAEGLGQWLGQVAAVVPLVPGARASPGRLTAAQQTVAAVQHIAERESRKGGQG